MRKSIFDRKCFHNPVFDTYKNAKWRYPLILQGLRHF